MNGGPLPPLPVGRRVGLVVEDEPDTRDWLVGVVGEAFTGMRVSAAGDLAAARAWLRSPEADGAELAVAVIDLALPDGSGIDLIREVARDRPRIVPVVATIWDDDAHLFDALAAGAQGYLLKDREAGLLARQLRRISQGEPPLSPSITHRILERLRRPDVVSDPGSALTPRETEVLGLLGRGLAVADAAQVLGLSRHTVGDHVKSIYRKLNIASRAAAALEAARRGLV